MKKIIIWISLAIFIFLPQAAYAIGEACPGIGSPCSGSAQCLPNSAGNPQFTCQDVSAQNSNLGGAFGNNFRSGAPTSIGAFVTSILPQVYTIALILVLVYLVWGAYRYMISGGDAKAVQAARAQLTWAVIGMIIVFLSYGIFQLVNRLLNLAYR